jgi:hypothetical protein
MEAGLAPPVENYGGEWSVFLALASRAGTHHGQAAPCFLQPQHRRRNSFQNAAHNRLFLFVPWA